MALVVRVKPRAVREIPQAAWWWALHRSSAQGAIEADVAAALAALVEQPGIGSKRLASDSLRGLRRLRRVRRKTPALIGIPKKGFVSGICG